MNKKGTRALASATVVGLVLQLLQQETLKQHQETLIRYKEKTDMKLLQTWQKLIGKMELKM
nr:hypothetical protein [Clostridium sporogenes]